MRRGRRPLAPHGLSASPNACTPPYEGREPPPGRSASTQSASANRLKNPGAYPAAAGSRRTRMITESGTEVLRSASSSSSRLDPECSCRMSALSQSLSSPSCRPAPQRVDVDYGDCAIMLGRHLDLDDGSDDCERARMRRGRRDAVHRVASKRPSTSLPVDGIDNRYRRLAMATPCRDERRRGATRRPARPYARVSGSTISRILRLDSIAGVFIRSCGTSW